MDLFTALTGAAMLAAGIAFGGMLSRRMAGFLGRDWIWAWPVILLAGVAFALADRGSPLWQYPAILLSGLFPALMATGAYQYAGRRRRSWPLVVGLAGALLRIGLEFAGAPFTTSALDGGPVLLAVAAAVVWRARSVGSFGGWIALGLMAMTGVELWDAVADYLGGVNQVAWALTVAVAVPLGSLQIVAGILSSSDQMLAERDHERLRAHAMLDGARDLVAELDEDSRILYVNARAEELLGIDPQVVLGQRALDFVPEAHREQAAAIWSDRLAGDTSSVIFPMPDRTGRELQLEVSAFSYHQAEERRLVVIARDVSDRLDAEEALRANEELFRAAFRAAPSIMLLTTPRGTVLDANEHFAHLSGWTREETVGRTLCEIWGWDADEPRRELLSLVNEDGALREVERTFQTRDGRERCVLASAESLVLRGRPCVLWQGMDITDRKRTEESLAAYRAELEDRVEDRTRQLRSSLQRLREQERLVSVGTLAAGIAHQINNPVGSILAASQYALHVGEGADGDAVRRQALESVIEEAQRCGRIVHSVLKFSRNEPTEKWIEDLNGIVRRGVAVVRPYAEEAGAKLELTCSSEPLPILASPIEVEQVVVNLIRNAVESRPEGALVQVQTALEKGEARIDVVDDGRGISGDSQSRIFEPFYTTRLEEGGSGLGLSVAHGVIVEHGGRFEVTSAPGRGTRVKVHIPLAGPDADAEAESDAGSEAECD